MSAEITPPLVAVVYYSGSGHTRVLARTIAEAAGGAALIDVEAMQGADWQALDGADAIIFGAPTYMGSTAARFDRFLEEASDRWPDMLWRDKIAAGFTVATFPSGDKLSALIRMAIYAAQMGMVWVGPTEIGAPVDPAKPGINRSGSWLGLMATSSRDKSEMIDADDLETARSFGARVAEAARRWRR